MSKPTSKKNIIRAGALLLLAAILTTGLVFFGLNTFRDEPDDAQAASTPVTIINGAVCKGLAIEVEYGNPGDRLLTGGLLTIEISDDLSLVEDTLTDDLGKTSPQTVSPTLISDSSNGKTIVYGPGSADNANAPGGSANANDIEAGVLGYFRFTARVNPGASSIIVNAVKATLTNTDPDLEDLDSAIWVQLTSSDEDGCIDNTNIGDGACTPTNVTAGDSLECVYVLLDNNGNPIPTGNSPVGLDGETYGLGTVPTSSIDTATGNSDQCYIEDRNGYKLVCENVPSDNATSGTQGVDVDFPDGTVADNAAQVTVSGDQGTSSSSSSSSVATSSASSSNPTSSSSSAATSSSSANSSVTTTATQGCITTNPQDCRMYFIGLDNAALDWNPITRFNDNYPIDQKFKDGKVDVYFDNIKRADGSLIANGSTCTFNFYRYAKKEILRTFTGTTNNGLCTVRLAVNDQTVNYYSVTVQANDVFDGQTMVKQERLSLAVGGDSSRQDVQVEIN